MPSTLSTPQSVYEEDLAKETAEKKIKNQNNSKNQKKITKSKKDKKKKNRTSFFLIFRNCPQKVMPRGTPSTSSAPSMCF